jgi:polar amino acid transport system substrate-binding protein
MRVCRLFLCLFICFIFSVSNTVFGQDTDTNSSKNQSMGSGIERKTITFGISVLDCTVCIRKADLWYTEAFKRLGYGFDYNIYPPVRGLIEVNSGRVDGEAFRVKFSERLQKQFPNLIRIPEPVVEVAFAAYSKNPAIGVQGWESLKKKDLLVGYIRGEKMAEENLPKYVSQQNLIAVTDIRQAIKMLASGRMNLFLTYDQPMESALRHEEFGGLDIQRSGTLGRFSLYPYLHKDHSDLVPRLAAVLRAMKADGTFDRLRKQAEKEAYGKSD